MNRPRKSKGPYPPCFYLKSGAYYLVKRNKWTRLGTDLSAALAEYGRLVESGKVGGMPKAIEDFYGRLSPKLAKSTREQYRYAADILKRKLQQFEPADVKSKHVAAIKQSMADTPNMANRVMSFLRQVFVDLVERQAVESNPCIGVKRYVEEKRTRLITDDEWQAIYDKAGQRLRIIMELQNITGQRIGDVLKIRRNQITDDGIMFEQQKTGARLLVRWTPELRAAVKAAKEMGDGVPTLALLRGVDGKPPDYRSVSLQWLKACEAAGVEDARLNDGRARSATMAKRQGKDAQALLGHTSAAMTERYIRDRETAQVDGTSIRKLIGARKKRE